MNGIAQKFCDFLFSHYLNGVEIDSVSDPTFTEGAVGLFIWSAEAPSGTISYDDFVLTALE